jgi:hypothetical protein
MSRSEKPCIQERIRKGMKRVFFSAPLLAILFLVIFFGVSLVTYASHLATLDYNRTKDLVGLIVTTDASLIAFSGVTVSMILKYELEAEKEEEEKRGISGKSPIKDQLTTSGIDYSKKRSKTIEFVGFVLAMLIGSIYSGFIAIIMQEFTSTILLSISLLFTGIAELLFMISYSL